MPVHPIRDIDNVVEIGKCDPSAKDMRRVKERIEKLEEDCPVCHGAGATTDHHDPCTECGGSGKVGGGLNAILP